MRFDALLEGGTRAQNEAHESRLNEAATHKLQLRQQLEETAAYLASQKKRVEELVHATGSASLTAEFAKSSTEAASSARRWRAMAGVTLTLLCVVGVAALAWEFSQWGAWHWESILARLNITIPFLLLAGYAAAQAHRYQKIEEQNRRVAVELSAIDPYLANLPSEAKNKLKADLAPRYFHGSGPTGESHAASGINVPEALGASAGRSDR